MKRTDNNTVILTTAYISTEEFPESEWYLPDEENDDTSTKKPIPADVVLKRQMRILEAVGFVNVNGFVRYNYKEAYIWPNEAGKRVIGLFNEKEWDCARTQGGFESRQSFLKIAVRWIIGL